MNNNQDEPEATTIIAAKAEDATVIVADKQVTGRTERKTEKLKQIHPDVVMGTAGLVADIQDLRSSIRTQVKEYRIRRGRDISYKSLLEVVSDELSSGTGRIRVSSPRYLTSLVMAGYDDEPRISSVSRIGGKTDDYNFLAAGSGEAVARGSLGSSYEENLDENEVKGMVINAIREAAEQGPYTGIGVDVAVANSDGVKIEKDLPIEKQY
jgi:20S proteasome alpha/beta subunit